MQAYIVRESHLVPGFWNVIDTRRMDELNEPYVEIALVTEDQGRQCARALNERREAWSWAAAALPDPLYYAEPDSVWGYVLGSRRLHRWTIWRHRQGGGWGAVSACGKRTPYAIVAPDTPGSVCRACRDKSP